ncbi:MAG: aldo/keto reductase [Thermodesulfovibrionales bacterium]|jgi:predicted aldo/keto reductase-like oxidoreductase
MTLPKRKLGKTGAEVTILGLGGEGILRTYGYEREAGQLINRAIDLGLNYFESARAYSGSENYYGLALKERRKELFLTSKSHARDREGALEHLRQTLENMKTDYLDLWQVHDVRTEADLSEIFGPRGAYRAFREAKEKGWVRHIGITGHHDPAIIKKCIEEYEFDTVLIPVNAAEPKYKSFIDSVIPVAETKGMGIVGMKVYLRGLINQLPFINNPEPFFRFSLTQPVSTVVIGCDSIPQLEENVKLAEAFHPMTDKEMQNIVDLIAPNACRLMYYKP